MLRGRPEDAERTGYSQLSKLRLRTAGGFADQEDTCLLESGSDRIGALD